MPFDAEAPAVTRASALALYAEARETTGDFARAALALAIALQAMPEPKAPKVRACAAKPNVRRGAPSRAFPGGVRLPIFQRQNCGHTFNSAGCAVCVRCQARRPTLARAVAWWPSALDVRAQVLADCRAEAVALGLTPAAIGAASNKSADARTPEEVHALNLWGPFRSGGEVVE